MGFSNKLLAKLFEGVLENREIEIRDDMMPMKEITSALDRLPISLSGCQRDAVANAWGSEISYVLQETRSDSAGFLPRKEWLHIRRFFTACAEKYFADQARLIPSPTATLYLQEHFDVTLTHQLAVSEALSS
jgi:hypothetical protein